MAYIGNQPAESFTSFATQEFSTSATTSYTLDHAVTNENEIALFVNNVRQQPGSGKAYTATGTALTLSAATASTDTMYCVFLGRALQTVTPATNSITAAMVGNDLISGKDALASEPADTDEFLVSDAGTLKRIDYSLIKGSGKIAQVVSASATSAVTITSGSFTDSGITANITPSATSSKILILISAAVLMHGNGRASSIGGVNILRDSTSIYGGGNNNAMGIYTENNTGVKMWAGHSHTFLDSPSSTSQITYKMQGRIETSGESMAFQTGGMNSVITLMEVLA